MLFDDQGNIITHPELKPDPCPRFITMGPELESKANGTLFIMSIAISGGFIIGLVTGILICS